MELDVSVLKPAISRREMYEAVVVHMKDMGFEQISTRRGKIDDLFHIDGRKVVGRGTIIRTPIGEPHLREIYETVYLKKSEDQWVHFSYGGYTQAARSFADTVGIALFEFKIGGRIAPRSQQATSAYRHKPMDRWKVQTIWTVVSLLALTLIIGIVITHPVVGWTLAGLVVLGVGGRIVQIVTRTG